MSIATETQRLIQAKTDLKTSIEKRGANVSTDNTIDTFANILDTCPFAVEGTFVPEENTKTFALSGLPFTPTSLSIICSEEVGKGSNRALDNFVIGIFAKGLYSSMVYTDSTGNRNANVSPTSSVIAWGENDVTVTLPSSLTTNFKKGFIYNYYVTGGIE